VLQALRNVDAPVRTNKPMRAAVSFLRMITPLVIDNGSRETPLTASHRHVVNACNTRNWTKAPSCRAALACSLTVPFLDRTKVQLRDHNPRLHATFGFSRDNRKGGVIHQEAAFVFTPQPQRGAASALGLGSILADSPA
jgi:hypothetical protein